MNTQEWFREKLKEFKDDPGYQDEYFKLWWDENLERFHQGHFNDREIALSAFVAGIEFYRTTE